MKNQILAVVVVLLLIGVAAFALLPGGGEDQNEIMEDVIVHVEDVSTGEEVQGVMDVASISLAEQFLMAFGQGAKSTPLLQAEEGGGGLAVFAGKQYAVWASCGLNVRGSGVQSISSTMVKFTGVSGPGTGAVAWNAVTRTGGHAGTLASPTGFGYNAMNPIQLTGLAVLNGNSSYDQSSTGYKFTNTMWANGAVNDAAKLYGDYLNGAKITVSAKVVAMDYSGFPVTAWANSTITLLCSTITGQLTASITNFNFGGPATMAIQASILDNQVAMVKMEV